MINPTYTMERNFLKDYHLIAGIDEVGRAPLAGPVVSAAVILDPEKIGTYRSKSKWWRGIRDSKTLSPRKRGPIADFIKENALDFGIGEASHREIDEFNIHNASLLSMKRAIMNLKSLPGVLLIDGKFKLQNLKIQQEAILDGDARVLSIAAASILAKVYRDDLMQKYGGYFPEYGFERHKGYDTIFHRKQLFTHGPCEMHRMSFATVRKTMNARWKKLM